MIRISSTGEFTGGTYNAAKEDQRIVLEGVDLTNNGANSETTIIQNLLQNGKLIVD